MDWEKQIENMAFEELKLWLWTLLDGGNPSPIPSVSNVLTVPYEYAEIAYKTISSPTFRSKMDRAIVDLFTKFSLEICNSKSELCYFSNLSYLIARLRVVEARDELIRKINTGHFVDQPRHQSLPFIASDLQFILLKTLLEFRHSDNIETFIRYFNTLEGRYSHICYRGLWEYNKKLGLEFLHQLAQVHLVQCKKYFNFSLEFGFYLEKHLFTFLTEYDFHARPLPDINLEKEISHLLVRIIMKYMHQSKLDIVFDNDSETRVSIQRIDLDGIKPPVPIFQIDETPLVRKILLSKYTSKYTIELIPTKSVGAESHKQKCNPDTTACYKLERSIEA